MSPPFKLPIGPLLICCLVLDVSSCAHVAAPLPVNRKGDASQTLSIAADTIHAPESSSSDAMIVPVSDLPKLDLAARVGSYAAQDAVWVPGQPIAVNRGFDFAIAIALEGMGAGIAAAQRQTSNADLARTLAALEPIDVQALLRAKCDDRPAACAVLTGYQIYLYGLLFGDKAARLRVVLEFGDAQGAPLYVSVSDAHLVADFGKSGVLRSTFALEIGHILRLLELPHISESSDERCSAGDSTQVTGKRISRDGSRVVLLALDPAAMLVTCGLEAVRLSSPASK
jgi:hypothetical protein